MFGECGEMNLDKVIDILKDIRSQEFSDGDAHPIAKITEGGSSFAGTKSNSREWLDEVDAPLQSGVDDIKQSLIGTILRATGFFVHVSNPAAELSSQACYHCGLFALFVPGYGKA